MMHPVFKAGICLRPRRRICFNIHFLLPYYPSSKSKREQRFGGLYCPRDWEESKRTLTLRRPAWKSKWQECWRLNCIGF